MPTYRSSPPGWPLRLWLALCAAGVLAAGTWGIHRLEALHPGEVLSTGPLLLAPMIGVNDSCLELPAGAAPSATGVPADLQASCTSRQGSAAALVESTLESLAPADRGRYALGYTLAVPLLQLFKATPDGWEIDAERVARVARTVKESTRPVVLYLFSTHFSANAPIEAALAQDPENLAWTREGPLATGSYYGAPVYNWSVARQDNSLTARREEAVAAVLGAVCQLPAAQRKPLRAVTLLGELHQLFPEFETGMGYGGPYRITDYSDASVRGFRSYLRDQFHSVAQFNRSMGSQYANFDEVVPPSRDIRSEPLKRFTEHIDAFAQGSLPIAGWAYLPPGTGEAAPWVHIYRDGKAIGRVRADRSRQDVLEALPGLGRAETGWRMDLDFRQIPVGVHRIDVLLEQRPGELTPIGTRRIAIMDARQTTPLQAPSAPLPATSPPVDGLRAHVDQPAEQASFYFNPLVPFWHAFRGQQVADYLGRFDKLVGQSCLREVPRYTHQIVPFSNPGWDENKFAIGRSLEGYGALNLGVSLYGDAADGKRFGDWLESTGHTRYGITEFHPLRAMDAARLRQTLETHAAQGAQFLSFFLEPRWHGDLVARKVHNPFSFDPDNPKFGSDVLYRSMQQVLAPSPALGAATPGVLTLGAATPGVATRGASAK